MQDYVPMADIINSISLSCFVEYIKQLHIHQSWMLPGVTCASDTISNKWGLSTSVRCILSQGNETTYTDL